MTLEDENQNISHINHSGFTLLDFNIPQRENPVVHSVQEAPLCEQCQKHDFTFFDPHCPGCYNILMDQSTSIAQIYAVIRQWVPQTQQNLEILGQEVLQRREDGSVDFYLYWDDYKRGFGDLNGKFWLGNDYIHQLTRSRQYELRVDLEDFDGNTAYAKYSTFSIDDEGNKYKLHIGNYSGHALVTDNGDFFSTRDRDNDVSSSRDCAEERTGAWWYSDCSRSNLNGQYLAGQTSNKGVTWLDWKNTWESLKHVEIKIRPVL